MKTCPKLEKSVVLLVALLGGCGVVTPEQWELGAKLCADHGGVKWAIGTISDSTETRCRDGAKIRSEPK